MKLLWSFHGPRVSRVHRLAGGKHGQQHLRVPRRPNLLVHVGAGFASTRRAISLSWLYCSKTIRTKHSDGSRRSNATSSRRSKATSPTRGEWPVENLRPYDQ